MGQKLRTETKLELLVRQKKKLQIWAEMAEKFEN